MGVVDSVRKRLSFSPSRSRTPTPAPIRRLDTTMPSLSREEINEILESPYETNYTYSDSVAYKPHIGSREYIHPRLCRRFPATPSPKSRIGPGEGSTDWFIGNMNWERYRFSNAVQAILHMLQFMATFTFAAMQYTFTTVSTYFYRILYFISITLLWNTLTTTILAPFYVLRSYWYQARFVWHTTRSIWSFFRWSWYWWTGQKVREEISVGVQTRSMSRGRTLDVRRTYVQEIINKRNYAAWLFLYIPMLLLLLGIGCHFYWPRADNQQQSAQIVQPFPQSLLQNESNLENVKEALPEIRPSDQIPPHLAFPIGGPPLNVQEEILTGQPQTDELSQIGGPFFPGFMFITRPLSRLTEITASFGQTIGHGISDIVLAFFSAIHDVMAALFESIASIFRFIVNLPAQLFKFAWNWIFIPTGNAVMNVFRSGLDSFYWIAEKIYILSANAINSSASLFTPSSGTFTTKIGQIPTKIWNFLRDSVFAPIGQFISYVTTYLVDSFAKFIDLIGRIPSMAWSFFNDWLLSPTSAFFYQAKNSLIEAFKWIGNRIGMFCAYVFQKLVELTNSIKIKAIEFILWTKNVASEAFSYLFGLFEKLWEKLCTTISSTKDFFVQIVMSLVNLIGWTGEKLIDGLILVKDGFIFAFRQFWNGILWSINGVEECFRKLVLHVFDKSSDFSNSTVQWFWWTLQKMNSFAIHTFRLTKSFLFNCYQHVVNVFVGIWQNASNFTFTPSSIQPQEQHRFDDAQMHILSRTPEMGELPGDHPIMQRIRQIVLQALAEERHFVDHRIRKWVEHNILVMKSQLKQLEPKIVEETKEKVEAEIFPPPPPSEEEFKTELRTEWESTMREMLRNGQIESTQTIQEFEEKMEEKIRGFVRQLNAQIHAEHTQISNKLERLERQQKEFEQSSQRKLEYLAKQGEPVVKQEKLIEKDPDGKEITRESTVLLHHLKRQLEEFDENALLDKVRRLIKQELRRFDADRTGMPDFALESSGGSVLSTRCTVQYNERSRTQKLFGIPLWYSSYSPRTVIQRKGYGASAGECWAYHGGHGFLTIGLSKRINVTAVSYEHLPVELSLDGHIRTAPQNFLVWSYQEVDDTNSRMLLGNFTYNAQGEPLQIFPVQQWDPRLSQIVELETLTNWGAPVTCLYRFRVHGDMMKVIPEEGDADLLEASHLSSAAHKSAESVAEQHDLF